jgi:hypothetical protein
VKTEKSEWPERRETIWEGEEIQKARRVQRE